MKEYYSFDPVTIRSESYWRNGKKDGIWTVYEKDGNVLQQVYYKKDSIIEIIKK